MNSDILTPTPGNEDERDIPPSLKKDNLLSRTKELVNSSSRAELIHRFPVDSEEIAVVIQTYGKILGAIPKMNIAIVEIIDSEKPADSYQTVYNSGQHKIQVDTWKQLLHVLLKSGNRKQDGKVVACLDKVPVKLEPRHLAQLMNVLESSIKTRFSTGEKPDLLSLQFDLNNATRALAEGSINGVLAAIKRR